MLIHLFVKSWLTTREWTMSQITHFLVVTFLSWKLGGVKRWTNIMSDFCSLVLSPTHSGSLCHCHSRNIPAPSGAHRLTRYLLESLRRCYIAPVFPALVLDNHHNHNLDSHLDDGAHLSELPCLWTATSISEPEFANDLDWCLGLGALPGSFHNAGYQRTLLFPLWPELLNHHCTRGLSRWLKVNTTVNVVIQEMTPWSSGRCSRKERRRH